MLQEFLKDLCQDLEIKAEPKLDEKKTTTLEVIPGVEISLQELDPGVYISAKLGECLKQKREDFFIALMEANLLGRGTGGAAISLDNDEKFLTLSLALPYEMNYRSFKEFLEDYVNYLIYWRDEIEKAKEEAQKLI